MLTISEVLKEKKNGLYYGNRVLLPFKAEVFKIVVHKSLIITDFSYAKHGAHCRTTAEYTEIYFYDIENLKNSFPENHSIKIVVVEKGKDVFNFENHVKLSLTLGAKHQLHIEELDEDILFIE